MTSGVAVEADSLSKQVELGRIVKQIDVRITEFDMWKLRDMLSKSGCCELKREIPSFP